MHGLNWVVKDDEVEALLRAAASFRPPASMCTPRELLTVEVIIAIHHQLDPKILYYCIPVFVCLTAKFYITARPDEFTIPDWKPSIQRSILNLRPHARTQTGRC